jgi:hypothetical protein
MDIGFFKYAPSYVKTIADRNMSESPKSYAMFFLYDKLSQYIDLRDRTEELTLAVKGVSGRDTVSVVTHTGLELSQLTDFRPVGAQYTQKFCIILS